MIQAASPAVAAMGLASGVASQSRRYWRPRPGMIYANVSLDIRSAAMHPPPFVDPDIEAYVDSICIAGYSLCVRSHRSAPIGTEMK